MVRAKFAVVEVRRILSSVPKVVDGIPTTWIPGEVRTIVMSPVCGPDNKEFWQATPSGKIELGCANLQAAEEFEIGKEYYIDFTPVSSPE